MQTEDDMQTKEECHLEEQLRAKRREAAELEAQLEAKTEARRKAKQLAGLKRQRTELEHERAAIIRELDDIAKQHAELKRRASELQRQRDGVVMRLQHIGQREAALMQGATQDAAPHGTPPEASPEKRAKTASSSPIPAQSDGHVGDTAGSHGCAAAQKLLSPPESDAGGEPAAVRSPATNEPTANGAKPPQPTSTQRAYASDSAPAASQYSPMPDAARTEVDDLPFHQQQRRHFAAHPDAAPSARTSDTTNTMAAAASAMVGLSRRRPAMEESTLGNRSPSATPLGNEATTDGGASRPRVSLPPPPPGSQHLPPPSQPTTAAAAKLTQAAATRAAPAGGHAPHQSAWMPHFGLANRHTQRCGCHIAPHTCAACNIAAACFDTTWQGRRSPCHCHGAQWGCFHQWSDAYAHARG